jgi:transcriptional regulator GlxA family with amidase domain
VIFTAGGLTSGIDLALHIVQLYGGIGLAEETAKLLEYEGTGWKDDRGVPDPIPQKMK